MSLSPENKRIEVITGNNHMGNLLGTITSRPDKE